MGLPPAAVRSYAHQLLSALAQLHDSHAVVHRDVKPSNMLLQQPFVVRTGKVCVFVCAGGHQHRQGA
jgi:serine/threonine protein kinase